jgi:prepilin-type N-terminal cleavage/methylation domain-containing protein
VYCESAGLTVAAVRSRREVGPAKGADPVRLLHANHHRRRCLSAFSLIELVIVIVILAVIGAIAIPKLSRGASGAADAALSQDLSILRGAMDTFNAEHPTTSLGVVGVDGPSVIQCLTQCSDPTATTFSPTRTSTCILGPYIKAIPAMPVGATKGDASVTVGATPGMNASGWLFTGYDFKCNDPSSDVDASGSAYNGY